MASTIPPAPDPDPDPALVPPVPASLGWVPAAMTAIGVVVALMASGFVAFLVYAYPDTRDPLGAGLGSVTVLGMAADLFISLRRR
ncbi:hypothetical protein ACFV8T_39270 [Streptomyces sp. NPDC059832]|uniref:hypothetical protein n=1 Tax=Streptomyces sp. NPDC059832 TaxID=3346966 RepID=UPI003665362D